MKPHPRISVLSRLAVVRLLAGVPGGADRPRGGRGAADWLLYRRPGLGDRQHRARPRDEHPRWSEYSACRAKVTVEQDSSCYRVTQRNFSQKCSWGLVCMQKLFEVTLYTLHRYLHLQG